MDVRAGPQRKLSTEELILSNCGAREDSSESLGLQGDQNQSILKEINPDFSLEGLMFKSNTLATSCEGHKEKGRKE